MVRENSVDLETWQTWCMRWTENPINEVRFLEFPHNRRIIIT